MKKTARYNRRKNEKDHYTHYHVVSDGTDSLHTSQVQTPDTAATDIPQVGVPNPASVYCTQKGNKLEISHGSDGSQNGVCVFPDGNTCDEWAYFRGECSLAAQKRPTPASLLCQPQKQVRVAPENGSGGYMPPGTSEELADWWDDQEHVARRTV